MDSQNDPACSGSSRVPALIKAVSMHPGATPTTEAGRTESGKTSRPAFPLRRARTMAHPTSLLPQNTYLPRQRGASTLDGSSCVSDEQNARPLTPSGRPHSLLTPVRNWTKNLSLIAKLVNRCPSPSPKQIGKENFVHSHSSEPEHKPGHHHHHHLDFCDLKASSSYNSVASSQQTISTTIQDAPCEPPALPERTTGPCVSLSARAAPKTPLKLSPLPRTEHLDPRICPMMQSGVKVSNTHYWLLEPPSPTAQSDSGQSTEYLNISPDSRHCPTQEHFFPVAAPLRRGRSDASKYAVQNIHHNLAHKLGKAVPEASEAECQAVLIGTGYNYIEAEHRLKVELLCRQFECSPATSRRVLVSEKWDMNRSIAHSRQLLERSSAVPGDSETRDCNVGVPQ